MTPPESSISTNHVTPNKGTAPCTCVTSSPPRQPWPSPARSAAPPPRPLRPTAKPTVTPIAKNLLSPLSIAQAPDGTRYWTDNFASLLYKQSPGGQPAVVYTGTKKGGVESVSADGGELRFTTGRPDNSAGKLMTLDAAGPGPARRPLRLREAANPDKKYDYGFLQTSEAVHRPARAD